MGVVASAYAARRPKNILPCKNRLEHARNILRLRVCQVEEKYVAFGPVYAARYVVFL